METPEVPRERRSAPRTITPLTTAATSGVGILRFPLKAPQLEELVRSSLQEDAAFNDITTIATVVALVLLAIQFWVLRRVRAGHLGGWQASLATYLAPLLLIAMTVVLVLMAGKPTD